MQTINRGFRRFLIGPLQNHIWQILILILLPLLANAPALSGIVKCDPELLFSDLGIGNSGALYGGASCYVDPTVAYISQPLGYLSAHDWLHGIIPWWDPYIGTGMPLAGEMQTQSFFIPFIFLMYFHNGWLFLRIILQILTGVFTYAFLNRLELSKFAACLGGVLFSLNGAFILTPHAPIGPIFCLPMMLLGIESIHRAAIRGDRFGWAMFSAGLALSVYAGFPEVAYFNGLLVFFWAIIRWLHLPKHLWARFGLKYLSGGVTGLALTAPLSNAFFQYLQNGYVGGHASFFGKAVQSAIAAPLQMFPFFYGALASGAPPGFADHNVWIRIGGWCGAIPVLMALYAFTFRNKYQAEKYFLLIWIAAFQCRYFGVFGFVGLFNLVPGLGATDILRFSPVSVMFPVFVLTAFGVDHLARFIRPTPQHLKFVFSIYAALCILSIVPVLNVLPQWFSDDPKFFSPALAIYVLTIIFSGFVIFSILSRRFISTVGILMAAGAVALFLLSQVPAPRFGHLDLTGVKFLQAHQDLSRAYSVGPLEPNYSAQYGIADINDQQLPEAELWNKFVFNTLFPGRNINGSNGIQSGQLENFFYHAASFESVGVKYLITAPGQPLFQNSSNIPPGDYLPVRYNQPLGNLLPPGILRAASISSVSVPVEINAAQSVIPLQVRLCAGADCAFGNATLQSAASSQPLVIALNKPINLSANQSLAILFSYPARQPMMVWLPSGLTAGDYGLSKMADGTDQLVLNQSKNLPNMRRTFHDESMDIYQLPSPAPYAELYAEDCELQIFSRQKFNSDCPRVTTLIRRELYYPGWRASINGAAAPITKADELFEQITVPAGPAKIRFTYMPPYTPLASAIASLAALFWLAAALLSRRRQPTT